MTVLHPAFGCTNNAGRQAGACPGVGSTPILPAPIQAVA
jgi:hypothetical protein